MSIIAQKLNYTYNKGSAFEKHALKDVSFEINDGEFVAVVGHTGSGKSTFVQHLNALVRVQSGSLVVNGYDLSDKKVDLKGLRKTVGMVFQYPEYQLFADTVAEDVAFAPKNFGYSEEETDEMVRNAIQLVGLDYDTVKNKSPFDLSGGEKRRVALAGVLATLPRVLALDEPTAGLDPRGKREILSLVRKLNKEQGITVIMVSHDMDEVFENADRVLVFNDGNVTYDTDVRTLFAQEDAVALMNLEVPQMARVINVLQRNGYVVPNDVRTAEEVFDYVAKGGKNA